MKKLAALGLEVVIERGAGEAAGYVDARYEEAGARIALTAESAHDGAGLVLRVRRPSAAECALVPPGAIVVCLLFAEQAKETLDALAEKKASIIALERVPRITRAQKMDVLSSMANLSGYRAVLEASVTLPRFMGAQSTAAGSEPPAKVLVIGAGVAGLAAIATARSLGAEVRAFDTRMAAKEQVESLGASFLTVQIEEKGEGAGGYAKEMSQAFIDAEMALFRAQAREVDVIVTTALVPGRRAPILVPEDVVEALKPGSVIVDLAAEQGGNCALTVPGSAFTSQSGVHILGYTDLPSRMATVASQFFAMNVVHLLTEMRGPSGVAIDVDNEIVRGALVMHRGETLPPPPRPEPSPAEMKKSRPPPQSAAPRKANIMKPTQSAWGTTLASFVAIAALFVLGRFAPGDFLQHFTVFILACFVGWQVIWSVSPSLHTPLMSVTNAISGIIIVGGMLQAGAGSFDTASLLGAFAILVASINVAGGFLVTQRMLRMFRKN